MARLFYNLGRRLGPKVRRARWVWQSVFGSHDEMLAAEAQVGADLADEVRAQVAAEPSVEARDLLGDIGRQLTAQLRDRQRRFHFGVVGGGEPNAFALPGGYIFLTRSIMDLCRWDRDELAFILAHEMAHVIKGHAMERIMTDSAIRFASRMTPLRGTLAAWLQRVGVQYLAGAYSRDLESEADRFATLLIIAAGFDPAAGGRLFARLADLGREPGALGRYFASHPPFTERINRVRRVVETQAK